MMQITNKHEIAILFILNLGVETKTIRTLSAEIGVSTSYLEQIARTLRQEGLIASVMGPGGGYHLTRTVQDIKIKDILLAGGQQRSGLIFNTIICRVGDFSVNYLLNEFLSSTITDNCKYPGKTNHSLLEIFRHTDNVP